MNVPKVPRNRAGLLLRSGGTRTQAGPMMAQVGDKLLADGNRVGLIIAATHEDGTPPYIVKWLYDGHVAMVFPDQHMRVERAGNELTRP